jgi:hypothetical protein
LTPALKNSTVLVGRSPSKIKKEKPVFPQPEFLSSVKNYPVFSERYPCTTPTTGKK